MIEPQVGMSVWYYDSEYRGPFAAIICCVGVHAHDNPKRYVNLSVFDEVGGCRGKTAVPLLYPEDDLHEGQSCTWPDHVMQSVAGE
jgi:hypothetical protein